MTPAVGLALAAAALLASPAAAGEEEEQARRAGDLMERLYEDHGNAGILREAEALLDDCLASGNLRTAEYLAGQVAVHRPGYLAERHRYVSILLSRGKREGAEKDLRDLLKEFPSDCAGHSMLAALLRDDGRWREALEVHEAHLREHPGEAGPLHAIASISLWDLRDLPAARAAAARMRAAADRPGAPAAWLRNNAAAVEADADRVEGDHRAVARAEGRASALLWAALAAGLLGFAGVARLTRRR